MKKESDNFLESVRGTFFEQVLKMPISVSPITFKAEDVVVGTANDLEKRFFSFYFSTVNPEKYNSGVLLATDKIKLEMRGNVVLGLIRSLISDRLQILNGNINKIWIDNKGQILLRETDNY